LAAASLEVLKLLKEDPSYRERLFNNTRYFRQKMAALGFDILPGEHPIVPVMLYDAKLASKFAAMMLDKGIYVVGFFYPVVPQGKARIRTQMSAGYSHEEIDQVIKAFVEVKKELI
jgi:glycine C-acetyltransferase